MSTVKTLLPQVRRIVLEERARVTGQFCSFGLSWVTWKVTGARIIRYEHHNIQNFSRFTSGAPKKIRGHVQAALSILAREGIMFTRSQLEGGTADYEHSERDKRFRVRISQAEAVKRLASMKD